MGAMEGAPQDVLRLILRPQWWTLRQLCSHRLVCSRWRTCVASLPVREALAVREDMDLERAFSCFPRAIRIVFGVFPSQIQIKPQHLDTLTKFTNLHTMRLETGASPENYWVIVLNPALSTERRLTSLQFEPCVPHLSCLRGIECTESQGGSDFVLPHLSLFTQLENMHLSMTVKAAASFRLPELPALTRLYTPRPGPWAKQLSAFTALRNLHVVYLVPECLLPQLARMTRLEKLNYWGNADPIGGNEGTVLGALPCSLTSLELDVDVGFEEHVTHLTRLRKLRTHTLNCETFDIGPRISRLNNLVDLKVGGVFTPAGAQALPALSRLSRLAIHSIGTQPPIPLPSVRALELKEAVAEDYLAVQCFPLLEKLSISDCPVRDTSCFTELHCGALSHLTNLKELYINAPAHACHRWLPPLPLLHTLWLSGGVLRCDDIGHFGTFAALTHLRLCDDIDVTVSFSDGFRELRSLAAMGRVRRFGCFVWSEMTPTEYEELKGLFPEVDLPYRHPETE